MEPPKTKTLEGIVERRPYGPDKYYHIGENMMDTALTFFRGHKVRVTIELIEEPDTPVQSQ